MKDPKDVPQRSRGHPRTPRAPRQLQWSPKVTQRRPREPPTTSKAPPNDPNDVPRHSQCRCAGSNWWPPRVPQLPPLVPPSFLPSHTYLYIYMYVYISSVDSGVYDCLSSRSRRPWEDKPCAQGVNLSSPMAMHHSSEVTDAAHCWLLAMGYLTGVHPAPHR